MGRSVDPPNIGGAACSINNLSFREFDMKTRSSSKPRLLASSFLVGALAFPAIAYAQDATHQPGTQSAGSQTSTTAAPEANADAAATPTSNANEGSPTEDIVVTGTMFRRTNTETPSPVTVLSSESLARRGITNPGDAIRALSSDNSGSIPLSFTGGFANGASGVSLRGLSVNSTLVLFDGMRGAYYPLPDDGQRSFVDLNTIPNIVIDRVEVLRDGASSTYGADAIGGVVNVITKKEFRGIQASGEAGITQRGDAAEHRFTLLAGTGSLSERGWNAYIGAEYYHADPLMNRARGFPFNTGDLSSLACSGGPCENASPGSPDYPVGTLLGTATTSAVVRRAIQTDPNNPLNPAVGFGAFQVLNPAGCGAGNSPRTTDQGSFCEQDLINQYGQIQPELERLGVTARATFQVGGDLQAYATGSYFQSKVVSMGNPSSIRVGQPIRTANIVLPVYVCSAGVNCTAANGVLNPNNPFAADGNAAQIFYRFGDIPFSAETFSRTYRGAVGIHGTVGNGWNVSLDLTGMRTNLDLTANGYLNYAGLFSAINTGSYNFVNPSLNTAAVRQSVSPEIRNRATSELYMIQANVTKDLFELPGGPLQLGVGASARYESQFAPNQNANQQTLNLNAYAARGDHWVEAAYFELNAPVLRQLEINLSGRYDHYSEGYDRFSPKIGAKFTPIPQLAIRGTYSRGFRAPQFAETAGNVIGYTTTNPGNVPSVCVAYGGTVSAGGGCVGGSPYIGNQAIGFNTAANPNIRPEKSQSFTGGVVFQPVSWFSLAVDYYNIRKTDVITGGPLSSQAIAAYYAGTALPAGYTITPNPADPLFPNAIPTVQLVNAPYENAASLLTDGIDFTATLSTNLWSRVKFTSTLEVTDILRYNFTPAPGEAVQRYVGTQGPYITSSGAGTPKWRGNWSNSLEAGPATLTATAYYTSGYRSTAEDQNGAGTGSDCSTALYDPAFCQTRRYVQLDLVGSLKAGNNFTLYMNVINALDAKPPFNPANYAAVNYNPTWSYGGIIGRMFRVGAKVSF
jgi:iron complex outermembrane receptor protein